MRQKSKHTEINNFRSGIARAYAALQTGRKTLAHTPFTKASEGVA